MQGGLSHERNVCLSVGPSVRLSNKRANCDETKETRAHILISYKKAHSPSFLTEIGGDNPLYLKFWAKLTPFLRKRRF